MVYKKCNINYLLIIIFSLSAYVKSQTITSVTPSSVFQGDTLILTITTSSAISNPVFKLQNGLSTTYPYHTTDLSNNTYKAVYLIREYQEVGNYYLYLNSSYFSVPIVVNAKNYQESFTYNYAKKFGINIIDKDQEGIKNITFDKHGNVYYVGSYNESWGYVTFDGTPLNCRGVNDGFIAKYNSAGKKLWVKTIGSAFDQGYEGVKSIKILNDSLMYICGYVVCDTSLKYDYTTPIQYPKRNEGSQDGFIAKIDSSGKILWTAFQGSKALDSSNDIEIGDNGSVYVTGYLQGEYYPSMVSLPGFTYVYSSNGADSIQLATFSDDVFGAFIAKYNSNGDLLWAKREVKGVFSNSDGIGIGLRYSPDHSIVVLVSSTTPVQFDSLSSSCSGNCCNPSYSLLKIDTLGNTVWCAYGGVNCRLFSMDIDRYGNIYFPYTEDFHYPDKYLIKYSPSGGVLWNKDINNCFTNKGNYYATTDSSGNTYVAYNYEHMIADNRLNILVKKFDSNGNVLAITYPQPYTLDYDNLPTAIQLNYNEDEIMLSGIFRYSQTFGSATINSSYTTIFAASINVPNPTIVTNNASESLSNSTDFISIFPNPTSGILNISIGNNENVNIVIYNNLGQIINQFNCNKYAMFDFSNFKQGVYLLKIQGNEINYTRKVSVE